MNWKETAVVCRFLYTREVNVTGQCDYLVSPPNVRGKRRWSHMVFSVTSPGGGSMSMVFLVGEEISGIMSANGKGHK